MYANDISVIIFHNSVCNILQSWFSANYFVFQQIKNIICNSRYKLILIRPLMDVLKRTFVTFLEVNLDVI